MYKLQSVKFPFLFLTCNWLLVERFSIVLLVMTFTIDTLLRVSRAHVKVFNYFMRTKIVGKNSPGQGQL